MRRIELLVATGLLIGGGSGQAWADEAAAKPQGDKVVVTASADDGFTIRSADGSFRLNLTGYAQGDGRFYLDDTNGDGLNTFVMRQVRPMLTGTVSRLFDFNITPDFGGGQVVLQDAFMDARFHSAFKLKAGKFKPPVGIERLQPETTLTFIERGLPTDLVPSRDVGLEAHGDLAAGIVTYELGVFNGALDGGLSDGDTNDGKDIAARLFIRPFKTGSVASLKALGFGVAGTTGKQTGALPSYKTVGQLTFFNYATNVTADGVRRRITPQLWYQGGPLRVIGEYVSERARLQQGSGPTLTATHTSWHVMAAVVLTGEPPLQGVIVPRKPFDPKLGSWGAVEVAARYSSLSIDEAVFAQAFADATKSARTAHEFGLSASWYLTRWIKFVASYDHTTFEGGAASGNRNAENALFLRSQVGF
jgi:phosphate-selective porin OprO/OprP